MGAVHEHHVTVEWTGNQGQGTSAAQGQSHRVSKDKHEDILCSVPSAFGGDDKRYNPEELLLAALSSCHMLVYLYLCVQEGVNIVGYTDAALLKVTFSPSNGAEVTEAILRPRVFVSDANMVAVANALHGKANAICMIANASKFPVHHEPTTEVATS